MGPVRRNIQDGDEEESRARASAAYLRCLD
jgi:hypothetical protein